MHYVHLTCTMAFSQSSNFVRSFISESLDKHLHWKALASAQVTGIKFCIHKHYSRAVWNWRFFSDQRFSWRSGHVAQSKPLEGVTWFEHRVSRALFIASIESYWDERTIIENMTDVIWNNHFEVWKTSRSYHDILACHMTNLNAEILESPWEIFSAPSAKSFMTAKRGVLKAVLLGHVGCGIYSEFLRWLWEQFIGDYKVSTRFNKWIVR